MDTNAYATEARRPGDKHRIGFASGFDFSSPVLGGYKNISLFFSVTLWLSGLIGVVRYNRRGGAALIGAILLLSLLAGCGYRLAGSADNRLASGQSLWVAFIANETVSPTAQTVLRRSLLEEAHSMRGMVPAGSMADANLLVSGALRSYTIQAVSYTAADRAREFRLTIAVELELHRQGETAPLWKGTLQSVQDYPANTDLALQRNSEEAALAAAGRKLARKFLSNVEQSY